MDASTRYASLQVLIVDDSEYMRRLLKMMLRAFGVGTIDCIDGAEMAMRQLRADMPDLLVTDWMMGGMTGIDLVRRIRRGEDSLNPFLPIIMITGHANKKRIAEARDAGVNEFLAKPVAPIDLAGRLEEVVQRPRNFVRSNAYFGPDRRRHQIETRRADRRSVAPIYTTPEQIGAFVEELRERMAQGPVARIADAPPAEAEAELAPMTATE